jgi:enamine deaminase RidA (YjgF/YER057c/UK114 family)
MMTQVLGESGKHSRAAVSVNSLPLGAAVEIEAIFEIN